MNILIHVRHKGNFGVEDVEGKVETRSTSQNRHARERSGHSMV